MLAVETAARLQLERRVWEAAVPAVESAARVQSGWRVWEAAVPAVEAAHEARVVAMLAGVVSHAWNASQSWLGR